MKTFKIYTLGCKVNQYETQAIREDFISAGWKEINSQRAADIYVINSCTVTSRADSKSFDLIRRAKAENPKAKIVLTGCLVYGDKRGLRHQAPVDFLINNQLKNRILEIIKNQKLPRKVTTEFLPLKVNGFKGHSRAFVKIQDGCDNRCAYCKIPLVRGKSRSRSLPDIKQEVEKLTEKGFREIVLTGICLGAYGKEFNPPLEITDVINELEKIKGDFRIRLSSIEARDITDRLIDKLASSDKLCNHLHIPFQSGDDEILKRMQRNYTVNDYLEAVRRASEKIPCLAVTTDIMVGFPGEEEENFQNTLRFIEMVSPSRIHIFPFSPRPGTRAWNFTDRVAPAVVKRREETLRILSLETAVKYHKKFQDQNLIVLTEHKRDKKSGLLKGYSQNYIPILFAGDDGLMGKLIKVKVERVERDGVFACQI